MPSGGYAGFFKNRTLSHPSRTRLSVCQPIGKRHGGIPVPLERGPPPSVGTPIRPGEVAMPFCYEGSERLAFLGGRHQARRSPQNSV